MSLLFKKIIEEKENSQRNIIKIKIIFIITYVQKLNVPIMQFTSSIAICCVLHRFVTQEIHC